MDSHHLAFPDETFTTSVSNINVTTYTEPLRCLQEMHRTLKPDGLAIVSIWKRFGVANIIHAAQKLVREDSEPMKIPKAEFMQDGYLRGMMTEAGYHNVTQRTVSVVCTGEDLEGLRAFTQGAFTSTIREKWTEAEQAHWPGAVEQAIAEEVKRFGGIKFEAWFVTGDK